MYIQFEDENFYQKPVGMWKIFNHKIDKRISYQELEKRQTQDDFEKVVNNRFNWTQKHRCKFY